MSKLKTPNGGDAAIEDAVSGGKDQPQVPTAEKRPILVVKGCRGRLGGSALLTVLIQRARWNKRNVVVLDGDEGSKTLRTLYPEGTAGGALVPDGRDAIAFKDFMLAHMNQMVADRTSRVVDTSGGSKDLPEVLASMNLSRFCRRWNLQLIWVSMLGPDPEDFEHAYAPVRDGNLDPKDLLMVQNHGVLRGGNPDKAFLPIMERPEFQALIAQGARCVIMPSLYVMKDMREALVDFYEVAAGTKPIGDPRLPVWSELAYGFLEDLEKEFIDADLADILP